MSWKVLYRALAKVWISVYMHPIKTNVYKFDKSSVSFKVQKACNLNALMQKIIVQIQSNTGQKCTKLTIVLDKLKGLSFQSKLGSLNNFY